MSLPVDANQRPEPFKGLSYPDDGTMKTPAGATTGGLLGAFAAIGTMSVVGLTPLLMVAPIIVAGGAAAGVLAGTMVTGLAGFGITGPRQDYYQKRLLEGSYLVAVKTEDESQLGKAQKVFSDNRAQDIESYRYTRRVA